MVERARVLVVEDDPAIRDLLVEWLTDDGYQVRSAGDGAAGFEAAHDWRPQVILTDLLMPVVDGWGLVRLVGHDATLRGVSFIGMTASHRLAEGRVMALNFPVLGKPFTLPRLTEAVAAAAERSGVKP